MRISQQLVNELVAHAKAELPNECCGLIEGKNGRAVKVRPVRNAAASPLRFEMESQERYNAWKAIETAGNDFLAIYHSHTKTHAYPSQTDVNEAVNWPEQIYVIISLENRNAPVVRAYWLKDKKIAEAELVVE